MSCPPELSEALADEVGSSGSGEPPARVKAGGVKPSLWTQGFYPNDAERGTHARTWKKIERDFGASGGGECAWFPLGR